MPASPGQEAPYYTIEAATLMVTDRTCGLDETTMRAVVLLVHAAGRREAAAKTSIDYAYKSLAGQPVVP